MADENNAVFSQEEQGRFLLHLGYSVVNVGSFLSMGVLALTENMFVAVNALQHVPQSRVGIVRDLLSKLDALYLKIFGATDFLYAEQVDQIKPNLEITNALRGEYDFWSRKLADSLGVYQNPYSNSMGAATGRQPMIRRVMRVV